MQRKDIGIFLSVLILITMVSPMKVWAQFGTISQQPQTKNQFSILNSENGRFAFGQISESSKDKFMLDTLTGRLWRIAESGGVGLYLTPVLYRVEQGEYNPVPEEVPNKVENVVDTE
jgi:hypothetical protein